MLWRCWLSSRKGIQPVKTEWWSAGVVICLERGADLHVVQLMPLPPTVSCSSKIQTGFTFLVPAYPANPGQRAVKRVCVSRKNLLEFLKYVIQISAGNWLCGICRQPECAVYACVVVVVVQRLTPMQDCFVRVVISRHGTAHAPRRASPAKVSWHLLTYSLTDSSQLLYLLLFALQGGHLACKKQEGV